MWTTLLRWPWQPCSSWPQLRCGSFMPGCGDCATMTGPSRGQEPPFGSLRGWCRSRGSSWSWPRPRARAMPSCACFTRPGGGWGAAAARRRSPPAGAQPWPGSRPNLTAPRRQLTRPWKRAGCSPSRLPWREACPPPPSRHRPWRTPAKHRSTQRPRCRWPQRPFSTWPVPSPPAWWATPSPPGPWSSCASQRASARRRYSSRASPGLPRCGCRGSTLSPT